MCFLVKYCSYTKFRRKFLLPVVNTALGEHKLQSLQHVNDETENVKFYSAGLLKIHGSFEMFAESVPPRGIQKSTIIKLHFLQSILLVQLYTSASDCKGVGNIPGSHFVKAFSALR